MDDFERDHPGFDWKNIPAYKHPGGKDCPCPKHEYVREQIKFTKNVHDSGGKATAVTLKFCPDHHRVYRDEVIPSMPFKYRVMTKIALKIGAIRIELLNYMSSVCVFTVNTDLVDTGKRTNFHQSKQVRPQLLLYLVYHDDIFFHIRGMSFYPIGCTGTYVMQEKPLLPLYARLYRYKTDMEYQAVLCGLCLCIWDSLTISYNLCHVKNIQ